MICDILDPDVIVLGGGMSNVDELYDRVPPVVARYVFSDVFETRILPARHGDFLRRARRGLALAAGRR